MNEQMIRALPTSVDTDFEADEFILIEPYDATNDTAQHLQRYLQRQLQPGH